MDWKSILRTVSPWIATALTGPLGGMAITAAADAFGLNDKTENAIKQALSGATPEQMLALKNADQQFALRMQEIGFQNIKDMEELAFKDRDSARNREIQTKDSTNKILAFMIVVAFIGVIATTLLGYAKVESVLAGTLVGYLSAKCEQVLCYYLSSTSGSSRKTELLAQAPSINQK